VFLEGEARIIYEGKLSKEATSMNPQSAIESREEKLED